MQDELDRRRSRLQERRYTLSGLPERKTLAELDWSYNPRLPKRDILELGTLKFIDAREDVLLLGQPGTGKSHVAKALALLAVERGYKVLYREAQQLIEDITEARELGTIRKYRAQLKKTDLLLIDDLFLRRLPASAGDELADVLMSRYEKGSTIITSNRVIEDWPKLLGDVVVVDAAARSADAPRPPAQVRGKELAAEGGRRPGCQEDPPRAKMRPSRRRSGGGV